MVTRFLTHGFAFALCLALPYIVLAQAVNPPRSFEAIATSPSEIRCFWLPAEGATGYRIFRDGQKIADLPKETVEFDDKNLTQDSLHTYTVEALADDKSSTPRSYVERTFSPFPTSPSNFDLVIVQASSGGVAAAFEAARRGLRVALCEPTTRFGGMPVNGLSATDLRRDFHASGFLTKFRDRVKRLYELEGAKPKDGIKLDGIRYEPRIAHQAMKSLLYEVPNLTLFRRTRLAKVLSETTEPGRKRVRAIQVEELNSEGAPTGKKAELSAKVFIDSTDSGDLAAWAGAPYRIGREPRSNEEPHNGVIYYDRPNDKLLPGSTGRGDKRMQSYGYLLTVKDYGTSSDRTIPKPPGYDSKNYDKSPSWKISWAYSSGKLLSDKYELNQHPQGGDLQEINYRYSEGDYRERARVEKLYRDQVMGYLYWLQTAQGQTQLGLPDDEYRDSGGFPPLLYVREGRRILGETLLNESDIAKARDREKAPFSIGIGDYPMDSHAVRTKTDWSSPDMGEGEWWLFKQTPWHELPLGVTIPKTLDNVFVTTVVSSTHVSFGTYRMEPVRMAFGQASAIAATYCIQYHLRAKDVPTRQVQDELLPRFANPLGDTQPYLSYFTDLKPGALHYDAIQYLAARGFRPDKTDEFKPDAPVTKGELAKWLTLLAARGNQSSGAGAGVDPSMGIAPNQSALVALKSLVGSNEAANRGEIVSWLAAVFPSNAQIEVSSLPYADIADPKITNAMNTLSHYEINSILWDSWSAYAPDGNLRLQPTASLRRDQLFIALYLIQIHLGPLFQDHPLDR